MVRRSWWLASLTVAIAGTCASGIEASAPHTSVDGGAHAKGIAVARVRFPTRGEITGVGLALSNDGINFQPFGTDVYGRQNMPLYAATHRDGESSVCVPVVFGRFQDGLWVFDDPGTYHVRWSVDFAGQGIEGCKAIAAVDLEEARQADVDFLERLREPALVQALHGESLFGHLDEEARAVLLGPDGVDTLALSIIQQLLNATRADDPADVVRSRGSGENALRWAQALGELAEDLPESSYAPYAAYYAGCCHLAALRNAMKEMMIEHGLKDRAITEDELASVGTFVGQNEHYARATALLTFTIDRADEYLKPRALYMRALSIGWTGAFDEASQALDTVLESAPGERTILGWVDAVRRRIEHEEQEQARRTANENSTADPPEGE